MADHVVTVKRAGRVAEVLAGVVSDPVEVWSFACSCGYDGATAKPIVLFSSRQKAEAAAFIHRQAKGD